MRRRNPRQDSSKKLKAKKKRKNEKKERGEEKRENTVEIWHASIDHLFAPS